MQPRSHHQARALGGARLARAVAIGRAEHRRRDRDARRHLSVGGRRRRRAAASRGTDLADVSRGAFRQEPERPPLPSLVEQLRLVPWLRMRSLRNGLRNKNRRMDLLGIVVSGLFSSILGVGVTFALFAGTKYIFEAHHQPYLGLIFLGLLIWWQLFP